MSSNGVGGVTIDLPSRGLFYGDLLPEGKVPAKPLDTEAEKILVQSKGNMTEIIDFYINASLTLPEGLRSSDLLTGDRQYALYMIRAASLGPMYHFSFRCEDCRKKNTHMVNILDLDVNYLEEDASEPFEVELPVCGDVIKFRLFRGHDERETQRRTGQKHTRENLKSYQLARVIVAINGEPVEGSIKKAEMYVKRLIQADSNELRLAIEDEEPGLDLKVAVTCDFCMAGDEVDIPMDLEFFRPSQRQRKRRTRAAV